MMTKYRSEAVNKPAHYAGDIECIDAMVQQFGAEEVKSACVIQAFEMLWRWNKKGHESIFQHANRRILCKRNSSAVC